MTLFASCVARREAGVLLLGASGAGKSDLALRLLGAGFELVADDQVEIREGWASPAPALAGLLEVRGLGIFRLPHRPAARLALVVRLGQAPRLPEPARFHEAHFPNLDLPMVIIDPSRHSAPLLVALALDGALGEVTQVAGAFA